MPLGPENKSLTFNLNAYVPIARASKFVYDSDWTKQEKRRLGIPDNQTFNANVRTDDNGQVMLFNESGAYIGTIKDVANIYFKRDFQEKPPFEVEHAFTDSTFVQTDLSGFKRAKVKSLHMVLEVRKEHQMFVFNADDFIAFTLINLSEQTRHLFNENKKLIK